VILTQVIEIDLDGDGIKEVLVGARRFTMAHLYDALNDGDYSMIFLQQKVGKTTRNILIEGQFQAPSRPKTGLALTWQAVGLVDADGDGVMEIAVNNKYYEGGAAMLYKLKGDKSDVDMVFYEDWGA
jgi:hypothetical protein